MRHLFWVALLLLIATAWGQAPPQPQIADAQAKLRSLGFEVGDTAGVLDPLTAKALQAFQRTRRLAVTGELDTATLRALGLVSGLTASKEESRSPIASAAAPWRPVLEFLRFFDSQPARLVPYVTPGFREDKPPAAWIVDLMTDPATGTRHRLAWQIENIKTESNTAVVHVLSQVRVDGIPQSQLEAFSLVRSPDAQWLIDAWHATDAADTGE